MLPNAQAEQVLSATVSGWFRSFCGTSALDVARELALDHGLVLTTFEELADAGYGTMNMNVKLYQFKFDLDNPGVDFDPEPVTTHIFFPSTEALKRAYFLSDLAKQGLPEFTERMHLGAHQIGLAYFSEEVLSRYLDHPEMDETNDSLAGGEISSLSNAPDDRYLYVRYGKRRLRSGHVAVTAIYKDLSDMRAPEQRYWHAHELESPEFEKSDTHFRTFISRTYDGEFVDYHDPFSALLTAVEQVNAAAGSTPFFKRLENRHLRMPVEQTYKSYCDAASELYKVLGPDNVDQPKLKSALVSNFSVSGADLTHAETGRPLSTLQLFELIEKKIGAPGVYTACLRKLAKLRIDADHKILEPRSSEQSYSTQFADMCGEITHALGELADLLRTRMK